MRKREWTDRERDRVIETEGEKSRTTEEMIHHHGKRGIENRDIIKVYVIIKIFIEFFRVKRAQQ